MHLQFATDAARSHLARIPHCSTRRYIEIERRVADDGYVYTKKEFLKHYGVVQGLVKWADSRKPGCKAPPENVLKAIADVGLEMYQLWRTESQEELEPPRKKRKPENDDRALCKFVNSAAGCRYGDKCHFRHTENDDEQRESGERLGKLFWAHEVKGPTRSISQEVVDSLQGAVDLSETQLRRLNRDFQIKSNARGFISKADFVKLLQLELKIDRPMAEALFLGFDTNRDGFLNAREFIIGMASLSPQATPASKLDFVFSMYDADSDGDLGWNEIKALMKDLTRMLGPAGCGVTLGPLILKFLEHLDLDRNNSIGLDEFRQLAVDPKMKTMREEILKIIDFKKV